LVGIAAVDRDTALQAGGYLEEGFHVSTNLRNPAVFGAFVGLCLTTACGSKPSAPSSPDVWAVVDGREIRKDDVEKAYRRASQTAATSDDEAMTAKLSLLNELITQDILVAKAKTLGLEVTGTDLDAAFNDRKKNITDEAFQKELTQRNLTATDMKEGLRLELSAQKLIDHEVGAKINIGDADVNAFFNANRAQFNLPETAYHIAQIVITPVHEPQITNRLNDDATTPDAAGRKAAMLMERLKAGTQFSALAMDYSEDPQSAPQGGDLGFVAASALNQVPPALRDAVLKATPGTVSQVSSGGAHTLVLLIAREQAGQRDLSSPGVRDNITTTLHDRKEQLLRTAYLSAIRNDAKVVNYLARRIVESTAKPPAMLPGAPGK